MVWDAHLLDFPLITDETARALQTRDPAAVLLTWKFAADAQGWQAISDCSIAPAADGLRVSLTGADPFIGSAGLTKLPAGPVVVALKTRGQGGGGGVPR